MSTEKLDAAKSSRIDAFVTGLDAVTRQLAAELVKIPNTPDFQPEGMGYLLRYGAEGRQVIGLIEALRRELRLDYRDLQPELQTRLTS